MGKTRYLIYASPITIIYLYKYSPRNYYSRALLFATKYVAERHSYFGLPATFFLSSRHVFQDDSTPARFSLVYDVRPLMAILLMDILILFSLR